MDYALAHRQALIGSANTSPAAPADDQIKALQYRNAQKRVAAVNRLGDRWIFHPQYQPEKNRHHAPYVKHSAVLLFIRAVARFEGRL